MKLQEWDVPRIGDGQKKVGECCKVQFYEERVKRENEKEKSERKRYGVGDRDKERQRRRKRDIQ
jgi:hypothetical protein